MRRAILAFVVGASALLGAVLIWSNAQSTQGRERKKNPTIDDNSFAVVELFTSEGCSSCPSADAVLSGLVKDANENGRRVFCLAFQVDYWNKLGWIEPYGDPNHTRRQQEYARAFRTDQIYTPQMIVNGIEEFVGSDRAKAEKRIAAALKPQAAVTITMRWEKTTDAKTIRVAYEVSSTPKNAVFNLAIVESGLISKVTRGENAGRTLSHENVVRVFKSTAIDPSGKGVVEVKLPAGLVRKKSMAIGYVQQSETKAILGAAAIDLASSK